MVLPQHDWSQSPPPDEKVDELANDQKDKPKKPRHRHSAFQLAALNELYDQNDHPPLQARTSLAERLGMSVFLPLQPNTYTRQRPVFCILY